MTKINKMIFEFKRKYYLIELVSKDFNVLKTAQAIGANRGDIYNHTGFTHEDRVLNAKKIGLIK